MSKGIGLPIDYAVYFSHWNKGIFNFFHFQDSAIIDFYPSNFKIDLNGKKFAWQGVALLPFVDEVRLWDALDAVYPDLTVQEGD